MENDYMENDYKSELTLKIAEVFMRLGVRSVNMDDIARNLSVSKKTIYKYFKDKGDVVNEVTSILIKGEECSIQGIIDESENAIDEIIRVSEFANQMLKNMHPSVMFDLMKYYPESFTIFYNHKNVFVAKTVKENLLRGIEEGLYRGNLNADIISKLYLAKIDAIWNQEVFPSAEFTYSQIHLEMIRYHIRGIASPKGLDYLSKRISTQLPNL
ncbi:MAG: TetR/AcrR family transcriptional regulator [Flavobacteriales bacterium]|nr:TetR/AcrR family transcriptional regulator [Flavobacteriales bacterium]